MKLASKQGASVRFESCKLSSYTCQCLHVRSFPTGIKSFSLNRPAVHTDEKQHRDTIPL